MNANVHEIVSFGILIVVLATAGVWDYRTDKIPNWLTLASVILGFVWAGIAGIAGLGFDSLGGGLSAAAIGMLAGFLPMAFVFFAGGMGGGAGGKNQNMLGHMIMQYQAISNATK